MAGMTNKALSRNGRKSRWGQTDLERLATIEQAIADLNAGMRVSALLVKYGITERTLNYWKREAAERTLTETVETMRGIQNANLDEQAAKWITQENIADHMIQQGMASDPPNWTLVNRGMAQREKALAGHRLVSERRAKLNGLDAPIKVEASQPEASPADLALQAMIKESLAQANKSESFSDSSAFGTADLPTDFLVSSENVVLVETTTTPSGHNSQDVGASSQDIGLSTEGTVRSPQDPTLSTSENPTQSVGDRPQDFTLRSQGLGLSAQDTGLSSQDSVGLSGLSSDSAAGNGGNE